MKWLMAIAAVVVAMVARAEMADGAENDHASEPQKKAEAVKDFFGDSPSQIPLGGPSSVSAAEFTRGQSPS